MRRRVCTCAFFLFISLCASSCLFSQSPATQREELVRLLARQGITDGKVLAAIGKVPREVFVEKPYLDHAYENRPLPIGDGQTISQPFVVALMTQALGLKGAERVLEVGTGSGYQAAVLAQLVKTVFTVEIRKDLAEQARDRLARLGYRNVQARVGDGYQGWPEHAPFDAIMVTASAGKIPQPLLDQLAEGGRLIMPVGSATHSQELTLVTRKDGKLQASVLADVVFVRMIGEVEKGK